MTERKRRQNLAKCCSVSLQSWMNQWKVLEKSFGEKSSNYWLWNMVHVWFFLRHCCNLVQSGLKLYNFTTLTAGVETEQVCNAPINSKVQHSPPPPALSPGHLNFWTLACSNSLPSGQKSRSNAPPITTKIPLLKDKFRLQSNTLHAF